MAREAASNAAAEGATNCMSPKGQTLAASARQHRSYAAGYLTDHLGNRAAFLALTGTAGCALLLATQMPETRPMDKSGDPGSSDWEEACPFLPRWRVSVSVSR